MLYQVSTMRKNKFFFSHGTLSTKNLRIDCDWYVQRNNLKDSGIEGKQIKGTMVESMEVGKGYI